jgi:hypothetical protein
MMTFKLGIFGALLATGLIAGAGQAKADEVRGEVVHWKSGPVRAEYRQPAPDRGWGSHRPDYRRARPAPVPYPVYGYQAPAGIRTAQNPSRVAMQVRAELNRAGESLRFEVRHGVVEPRALAAFESLRQEIERDLSRASARGYISARDRLRLDEQVQEVQALRSQFHCGPQTQTHPGA